MLEPGLYTKTGELTTLQPGDVVRWESFSGCIVISRDCRNLGNGWHTNAHYPNGYPNDDKFLYGGAPSNMRVIVELMAVAAGLWFERIPSGDNVFRIIERP